MVFPVVVAGSDCASADLLSSSLGWAREHWGGEENVRLTFLTCYLLFSASSRPLRVTFKPCNINFFDISDYHFKKEAKIK